MSVRLSSLFSVSLILSIYYLSRSPLSLPPSFPQHFPFSSLVDFSLSKPKASLSLSKSPAILSSPFLPLHPLCLSSSSTSSLPLLFQLLILSSSSAHLSDGTPLFLSSPYLPLFSVHLCCSSISFKDSNPFLRITMHSNSHSFLLFFFSSSCLFSYSPFPLFLPFILPCTQPAGFPSSFTPTRRRE